MILAVGFNVLVNNCTGRAATKDDFSENISFAKAEVEQKFSLQMAELGSRMDECSQASRPSCRHLHYSIPGCPGGLSQPVKQRRPSFAKGYRLGG